MKHPITLALLSGALAVAVAAETLVGAPARAEVTETSESGFITRDVALVEANAKDTWLTLINPADWWSSQHTWSADAANLRLTPQAGGCFCEKIPEVDTPDSFTLEGSVEHMRVIQAYPESALRMVGGLGPLQSEPVNGVLTIALSEVDLPDGSGRKGTRIVWEYNVGGSMRYEVPVIAKAVGAVMSLQLAELAEKLGKVDMPEPASEPTENGPSKGVTIEAEATLPEGEGKKEQGPSVDDVFGDLNDPTSGT